MGQVYKGLNPPELWQHFDRLSHIPRCSGNETAARTYVQEIADAAGVAWKVDQAGNLVVYVPPRAADTGAPSVAIQAHLDMVCEKQHNVTHDFAKDPIHLCREGDLIFANGTTLGADNGIGVAAALTLLTQPHLKHGPLELIFTVEEETGLKGALALDASLVRARALINLDSEDPNELTVGSAGAGDASINFLPIFESTPEGYVGCEVLVSGLKGGHSGLQIHERHANAIKLLTDVLSEVRDAGVAFNLNSIEGGTLRNAIPRTAVARLSTTPDMALELKRGMSTVVETLDATWSTDEPDLRLEVREAPASERGMAKRYRDLLLTLLTKLPHGVLAMSRSFPDKVETSSNLARVQIQDGEVEILMNTRSLSDTGLSEVQSRIQALGESVGAVVETRKGYPSWEPNPNSSLLRLAEKAYENVYEKPANVQVVHGGLECGVLVSKLQGMEAISFGPLIEGAHTPEERVQASTVASTWRVLVTLLETLSTSSCSTYPAASSAQEQAN